MSVHVMSWVLQHSEEKLGARLVLLVLADRAREDGTNAWPSVESIARDARMSRRQVQRCLRDLEANGAITATGKHDSGTTIWGVNMTPGGATSTTEGGVRTTPEPSEDQPSGVTANAVTHREPRKVTLSGERREGGTVVARWETTYVAPITVDRKPVTAEEAQLAAMILHAWNTVTGQHLRAKEWLGKIVMRVREHPELTRRDHEEIIRRALADPWWKGDPSPSVVYGNGAVFERAMQAPAAAPAQRAHDIAQAEIDRLRRAS